MRQHGVVEIDRRRQDLGAVQGRARRRRLSERLDQSRTIPTSSCSSADQGAVVTLNGGETWSSWYNQPTGAALSRQRPTTLFRIASAAASRRAARRASSSRGNDGAITFRDWHPVGVDEYGYAAPDPLDPDIVYGGRTVTRYDRRTGQVSNVGPVGGRGGVGRRAGQLPHGAHACRSCSRRSTSARCSSPTTISGRRSTAA